MPPHKCSTFQMRSVLYYTLDCPCLSTHYYNFLNNIRFILFDIKSPETIGHFIGLMYGLFSAMNATLICW